VTDRQAQGWGNPDNALFRIRNISAGFTHSGRAFPGGVNKKIEKLAHALLDDLEKAGFVLPATGNWGYVNRDIRGMPGVKSNHSWGLALDVDAPHNPMTSDNVVHTNLPKSAGRIANRYGFIWGGDYTGTRKDPMHFEFVGDPADANRRTALLDTIPVRPAPQPSEGTADVDWIRLVEGDTGRKVKNVQALFVVNGYPNVQVDGTYGPGFTEKVKEFQREHGLNQTGNVGPKTYTELLKHNIEE
jgi:hypothetical protein